MSPVFTVLLLTMTALMMGLADRSGRLPLPWSSLFEQIGSNSFREDLLTAISVGVGIGVALAAFSSRVRARPEGIEAQTGWLEGVLNDDDRDELLRALMAAVVVVVGMSISLYAVSSFVDDGRRVSEALMFLLLSMVFVVCARLPDLIVPTRTGTMAGYARTLLKLLTLTLWWEQVKASETTPARFMPPLSLAGFRRRPSLWGHLAWACLHIAVSMTVLSIVSVVSGAGRAVLIVVLVSTVVASVMAVILIFTTSEAVAQIIVGKKSGRYDALFPLILTTLMLVAVVILLIEAALEQTSVTIWPVILAWIPCQWWLIPLWRFLLGRPRTRIAASIPWHPLEDRTVFVIRRTAHRLRQNLEIYDISHGATSADSLTRGTISELILPAGATVGLHPSGGRSAWAVSAGVKRPRDPAEPDLRARVSAAYEALTRPGHDAR